MHKHHHPLRAYRIFMLVVLGLSLASAPACKNKKKLAEQQAREAAERARQQKITRAKETLQSLLASPMSRNFAELEDKERTLADIRSLNLNDPDVQVLINEVADKLANERQRLEEQAAAAAAQATPAVPPEAEQLQNNFREIAFANSPTQANRMIEEVLRKFSSDASPVLIIIHKQGMNKDYDRPTTIRKYLNYLKDTRQNMNEVENIVYDANGKIKELELIKRY